MSHLLTHAWRHERLARQLVVGSWLLYAVLALLSPTSSETMTMGPLQRVFLLLTILIPVFIIWLIALKGAISFKRYAKMVGNNLEAPGVNQIADGLIWIIVDFVVLSLLNVITPYFVGTPWLGSVAVIHDYISAWIAVMAFIMLYRGSSQLRRVAHFSTWTRSAIWGAIAYSLFSIAFILEFYLNTGAVTPALSRTASAYIPQPAVFLTLIVPYLFGWFLGLVASLNIAKFAHSVKGILYRRALRDLAIGLCAVIFFTILIQVVTFASQYLSTTSLAFIFLLLYGLLLLCGVGFLLVRSGAHKLTRIEVLE